MRIAVVTTSYPAYAGDPSGHFVASEVRALERAGHELIVLVPRVRGAERESGPGHVVRLAAGSLFGWPGARARLAAAPWRAIGGARFVFEAQRALGSLGSLDRVIAHWIVPSGYPIALTARAPVEVVAHGTDVELMLALPRLLRAHLLEALLAKGASFRFVSESLRARLVRHAPAALAARSRVEPCRIEMPETPLRGTARRELAVPEDARLLVVMGRLVSDKRIDTALGAALLVPRAHVVVVGDGPERAALERRFPEARFAGQTPRPLALRWLAAADLLISASLREGSPTVVREARALGIPVVAAPAGDIERWAERDPELYVVSRALKSTADIRR